MNKQELKDLVERYKKTYIDNPSIMIAGFNQENQTVADYNGRQILELIQNSDDAGSNIIQIEIDTATKKLSISNNGKAFDIGGIESLMFPGNSPKNKTEYIGNKGLGFRSILNWVESVSIHTGELIVTFSKMFAEEFFKKHLAGHDEVIKRVDEERKAKKISAETIPLATLAFPDWSVNEAPSEFETKVVLNYKKNEEEKILKQLEAISEETLLFLPNSTRIVLIKNGESILDWDKYIGNSNQISIGNKTWDVYTLQDLMYSANVKFSYSIAWQSDLSDLGKFYNFFPTDVETSLPCLIHATFDLTNNRKEINKCDENLFILNQIAQTLGELAISHFKRDQSDWQAYQLLSPGSLNNRELFKPFYEQVRIKREEIACYPTIDNSYIKKNEAVFYGNDFSNWVLKNDLGNYFPNLLKATAGEINFDNEKFRSYSHSEWRNISKQITSKIKNHHERALLLKHLIFECKLNPNITLDLPLLIGEDFKFEEDEYQEVVFAYKASGIELPGFIKVTFAHPDFFNNLTDVFSVEIKANREGSEDISRTLSRILKPAVNLRQNDINEVIRYIVSEINNSKQNTEHIKSLVQFLFSIFSEKSDRRNKLAFSVPLLNRKNEIVESTSLVFGNNYEQEALTEFLFSGIYDESNYLAGIENYGLKETGDFSLVDFFQWLGVSKMIICTDEKSQPISNDFFDFIFDQKKVKKPDNARPNNITVKALSIKHLESLRKLELPKLLILLEKANQIKSAIHQSDENGNNELEYKYGNFYAQEIKNPYSYIYFQLSQLIDFSKYTLSEDSDLHTIYEFIDLSQNTISQNLNQKEIESLKFSLRLLGVSESIQDITEERLHSLYKQQEVNFPKGKNSQNFYKKTLEFFLERINKNEQLDLELSDSFFGRKGIGDNPLELISKEQLFYSDNYLLPKKILENFYFINLPKRTGEVNVKKVFGVNLIKDELNTIEINTKTIHNLNKELGKYIQSLKPFFLAYRIEFIKQRKIKQQEANYIKSLNVELLTDLKIFFQGQEVILLENEFIPVNDIAYLRAVNAGSVADLLKISEFCDTLTEIVCMTFKISSLKNTFRTIIKDGPRESSHILKTDDKTSLVEEAKELLGINPEELKFWKTIFADSDFQSNDSVQFLIGIENKLGKTLPDFYKRIDFSNFSSEYGINFLTWVTPLINLPLNKILDTSALESWHKNKISNYLKDNYEGFRKLLWEKSCSSDQLKEKFANNLLIYDNAIEKNFFKSFFTDNAFILEPEYIEAVKEFVLGQFQLQLGGTIPEIVIENKYKELFSKFTFGTDLNDKEKIIRADSSKIYSLLFFEGFEPIITEELKKHQLAFEQNSESIDDEMSSDDISSLQLIESQMQPADGSFTSKKNNNGESAYTSKTGRKKAASGKKEEEKVRLALERNGYTVNHVSKTTDSRHYDLEYKKPNDNVWRFLEVKKDSGGYFYLSNAEKETAISPEYSEKYDFAIVNGKNIHIIESPFHFNDESFDKNSNFRAEPVEYVLHFNISNKLDNS